MIHPLNSLYTLHPRLSFCCPNHRLTWGVQVPAVKKSNVTHSGWEGFKLGSVTFAHLTHIIMI